jgi:DNA-binding NarL/FixJ family response regulator
MASASRLTRDRPLKIGANPPHIQTKDSSPPTRSARRTRRSACSSSRTTHESRYALRLIEEHPSGTGYLLKERVSDLALLTDALVRLHEGECVVDPTTVSRLVKRARPASQLDGLTNREREVFNR